MTFREWSQKNAPAWAKPFERTVEGQAVVGFRVVDSAQKYEVAMVDPDDWDSVVDRGEALYRPMLARLERMIAGGRSN